MLLYIGRSFRRQGSDVQHKHCRAVPDWTPVRASTYKRRAHHLVALYRHPAEFGCYATCISLKLVWEIVLVASAGTGSGASLSVSQSALASRQVTGALGPVGHFDIGKFANLALELSGHDAWLVTFQLCVRWCAKLRLQCLQCSDLGRARCLHNRWDKSCVDTCQPASLQLSQCTYASHSGGSGVHQLASTKTYEQWMYAKLWGLEHQASGTHAVAWVRHQEDGAWHSASVKGTELIAFCFETKFFVRCMPTTIEPLKKI